MSVVQLMESDIAVAFFFFLHFCLFLWVEGLFHCEEAGQRAEVGNGGRECLQPTKEGKLRQASGDLAPRGGENLRN
jgi:hypothetical protein